METSAFQEDPAQTSWNSEDQNITRKFRARFPVRITRQSPYFRKVRSWNQQSSPKRSRRHCDLSSDMECKSSFLRKRGFKRTPRYVTLGHIPDLFQLATSSGKSNINNNANNKSETKASSDIDSSSNNNNNNTERNLSNGSSQINITGNNKNNNNNSESRSTSRGKTKSRSPSRSSNRKSSYNSSTVSKDNPGILKTGSNTELSPKTRRPRGKKNKSPDHAHEKKTLDKKADVTQLSMFSDEDAAPATSKSVNEITLDSCEVSGAVTLDVRAGTPEEDTSTRVKRGLVKKKSGEQKQRAKSTGAKIKAPLKPKKAQKAKPQHTKEEAPLPAGAEGDNNVSGDDRKSVKSATSENSVDSFASTQCSMDKSLADYVMKVYDLRRARFKAEVEKLRADMPESSFCCPNLTSVSEATECDSSGEEQLASNEHGVIGDGLMEDAKKSEDYSLENLKTIWKPPMQSLESSQLEEDELGTIIYQEQQEMSEEEVSQGYVLYSLCFLIAATAAGLCYVWDRKQEVKEHAF